MTLTTVVFDLDGTLVDSFDVMRLAFTEAFESEVGKGVPPFDGLLQRQGLPLKDILEQMNLPASMHGIFASASIRHMDKVVIWPGVIEMLEILHRADIKLAVATGKEGGRARALLAHLGIDHFFKIVVGGDEVPNGKPAPDIVERIIDYFGVRPGDVRVIGDALADYESASRAGVPFISAGWNPRSLRLPSSSGMRIANDPSEIPALIEAAP